MIARCVSPVGRLDGSEITGHAAQWTSGDVSIATVSQAGVVSAHAVGNADITVTSFIVSLIGAIILLAIVNLFRRGSLR